MKESTQVGIVILNWNSYEVTHQCLFGLRKHHIPARIILVDNGSEDGSGQELCDAFPEIVFIRSEVNLGFAAGNNLGIKYCLQEKYKYVMLLNNDTLFEKDFLSPLVEYLQHNIGVGAVQPKINYNHDRGLIWNGGAKYFAFLARSVQIGEGNSDGTEYNLIKEVHWITGCCFLVRTSLIEEVGMLDEHFFIYHEDVDWSIRMRRSNSKLMYLPISKIFHIAGVSQKMKTPGREGYLKPTFHYLNTRNQLYILRKHSRWYHLPTALFYHLTKNSLFLVYFLFRLRFQKARMIVKGVWDGLCLKLNNE